MSNLTELQAIRDQFKEELGSTNLAVLHICELLGKERSTVYTWLSKSQTRPIPSNDLKLLKLLRKKPSGPESR